MKQYFDNTFRSLFTLSVACLLTLTAPVNADLYVNGDNANTLLRFDNNGNYLEALLDYPDVDGGGFVGLTLGPDGALYITRGADNIITRYDLSTRTTTDFVTSHLARPHGLTFGGPDNDLFVANFDAGSIDRFSGKTGAFENKVIDVPGAPVGVAVDLQGNLYITPRGDNVYKYDGTSLTTFASGINAEAVFLLPDNNLYVGSPGTIYRYRLDGTPWGANGNTTDPTFASGGGLDYATGITSGPDGNLYVVDNFADDLSHNVLRYDGTTGEFLDVFATIPDGLSSGSWGLTFAPAPIPEPEIYVMLLSGLGLIGFAARRRKVGLISKVARIGASYRDYAR